MNIDTIKTLGDLKKIGYQSTSIKDELRANLIQKMKLGEDVFKGVWGYEDSVIPELETAILSRHNINLLGLRGQAKTRLARLMVNLLDEYIPFVRGSEINDDPLRPLSRFAIELIKEKGDETPIGHITSGGFGPTFEGPVAMGYVTIEHSKIDTVIYGELRGKRLPVHVASLPFIPANFKR